MFEDMHTLHSRHRGGSEVSLCMHSSVCRCCCHGNGGWNWGRNKWIMSRLSAQSHSTQRSGCDLQERMLENNVSEREEVGEMRFCPTVHHAPCSFFHIHRPSAHSLTTVSSGPPLKIREQLSLDYLILRRIPRIPRTELSWGWYRQEEWSWEPFLGACVCKCLFWTVLVSWQWTGRHQHLLACVSYMNPLKWGQCTQLPLSTCF